MDGNDAKAAASEPLLTGIAKGHINSRLSLRFYRDVNDDTMINALADSLKPRLDEKNAQSMEELAALNDTLRDLSQGAFKAGSTLDFDWDARKERLVITKDDGLPATIPAKKVAPALFNVYLDESPVSPDAKASFVKGSERLMATFL